MRMRVLLLISGGLNLVLATGWYFARPPAAVRRVTINRPPRTTNVVRLLRTNVFVQASTFRWKDIESNDYLTYIQNLRSIGCPETTIRDIIVADVNQLYAHRRATEISSGSHQWWRSDPDMDVLEEASDKIQALDRERRDLLTRLLGPNWDVSGNLVSIPEMSITFDGPELGTLPLETKLAVRDIITKGQERAEAYKRSQASAGAAQDPAELAKMRQQTRDELAKVLNPAQLEEYLLRYSGNANQLRDSLRGFDATPDEFRAVFKATDSIDLQIQALQGLTDSASVKKKAELEQQRDDAIKKSLSSERFTFYQLNSDPTFQQARDTAEQIGAAPETVLPLYQINQETDKERQRIMADGSLTPEEQSQALADVYRQQLDSIRKLLGDSAFQKFQAAGATPGK